MIQEHSCSKNGALLVLGLQACCNMLGGEEHRAMALPTGFMTTVMTQVSRVGRSAVVCSSLGSCPWTSCLAARSP